MKNFKFEFKGLFFLIQIILLSVILSACLGKGNSELQSGSLGLALTIEKGGDQILEDPSSVSGEITLKLQNSEGAPSQNSAITFQLLNPDSGAKLIVKDAVTDSTGTVKMTIVGADDFGKKAFILAKVAGTTIEKKLTIAIRDKIVPTRIEIVEPPATVVANTPYTLTLKLTDVNGRVAIDPDFNTEITVAFGSISGKLTDSNYFNKTIGTDRIVKFENGIGYLKNIQYKVAETINLALTDHGKIPALELVTGRKMNLSDSKSMKIIPDVPTRLQLKDPNDATTDDTIIVEAKLYDQFDNFAYNYTNLCNINLGLVGAGGNNPWIIDASDLTARSKTGVATFSNGSATYSVRDSSVESVTATVTSIAQGCGGISALGTPVSFLFNVGAISKIVFRTPVPTQAKTTGEISLLIESADTFGNLNNSYNGTVKVGFDQACLAQINAADNASGVVTLNSGTKTIRVFNRNLNRNQSVTCSVSFSGTTDSNQLDLTSSETLTFVPGNAKQLAFTNTTYQGKVGWGAGASQRNPSSIGVELLDYYGNPIFSYTGGGTAQIVNNGSAVVVGSVAIGTNGKGSASIYNTKNETVTLSFSNAPAGIRYSVGNTESVSVNTPVNLTSSLYFEWGVANYFEMVQPVAGNVDNTIPIIIKAYDYGDNLVQDYGISGTPMSDLKLISSSGTTSISNTIDFVSGVAQVNLSNTKEEIVQLSMALQSGTTFVQNSKGQNIDYINSVRASKSAYFKWGDTNRKFILNGDNNLSVDGRARLKLQILDQYDNPVRDYGCDSVTADVKLNVDGGAKLSASSTFDHTNLTNYNALSSLQDLDVVIQSGGCSTLTTNPSQDLTSDASFGYLYLYNRAITPAGSASKTINVTVSDINSKGYSISPAGGYQVTFSPGALAKYSIAPMTGTVDNAITMAVQAKDQFDNHIINYVANDAVQFRWVTQGSASVVFNGGDNRATGDLYLDFLSGNNGQAYIDIKDQLAELVTVGLTNVTGIDTTSTAGMTFSPGVVTEIAIYAPTNLSTITTDDKSLFTLKTLDQYGNHNTSYGQDIKVSIADPNNVANSAGIVTNPTVTNSDNYVVIPSKTIDIINGVGTLYAYDKIAETVRFNLIDDLGRTLTLNPLDVTFNHGVPTQALLTQLNDSTIDTNNLSAQVNADISAVAVVTVTDKNNNKALSYNNDFSVKINSGVAELRTALPNTTDLPNTSNNQVRVVDIQSGEGTLYILARRATPVVLSLTDSQGSGLSLFPKEGVNSVTLNVVAGSPLKYGVIIDSDATILGGDLNALPTTLGQGDVENNFNVTINAYDQYNNVATSHNEDVYFQVDKNAQVLSSSLPNLSTFISASGNAAIVKITNGTGAFKIYDRTAENGISLSLNSSSGANATGLDTTHSRLVNFSFGAPNYFAIVKPTSANSVELASPVRVEIRDQYHNIVSSGFQGAVDFNVNGAAFLNNAIDINAATGLPTTKLTTRTINFTTGNSGFALMNVYDRKAEVVSYSLSNGVESAPGTGGLLTTDQANPTEVKEQTFFPGVVDSFAFTAPRTIDAAGNHVTADGALQLEVKAYDKYNNFANNFAASSVLQVSVDNGGSVVSSSDQTTLISNAKIDFGGVNPQGVSRFYVKNTLAGVTNISLVDYNSVGYTVSNVNIQVGAGAPNSFKITNVQGRNDTGTNASLSPVTDNPIEVSVTAYDLYNNIDLDFSGAVDFQVVSDVTGGQSWVGGTTLNSFSNGVGIKQFNKTKVGNIVIGLTAPVTPTGMDVSNANATATIFVNPGAPVKYGFNATTGPYVAGQDIFIDIEARDTNNNRATAYSGAGKDVNVQFTNGTVGTFKDAGSYVAGPYLATFNSGLATITIRKDSLSTSYPVVGETLTLGFLAASDTSMNATATKNYSFVPGSVDRLSVVLDPSANSGNVSPYSIDNFVTARVEARDQYGNFNNTFTNTFDFTVNKNAWLWQDGVVLSAQNQTIKSANLAVASGVANIKIGDLKAETNVNLVPSNSAAAVTTFESALIDFMHGAGKEYELVFTDYPSISNPSFDTDKATPMLLNVVDVGGNRVLNYATHNVGLTSVSTSSNTFQGLTGTTVAGIPYVAVVNGQAGFSYRGRAIGNYTLNVSDSLKDNALSKTNTARSITVLPGTVSKLVIDAALSFTADDLLVGDPLVYSQGACPAAVAGVAICPKPLKQLKVLPKDQFDNVNDIEGTKSYSVSLIAKSTPGNISRWSEPIKIIGAKPFMADGVTPFNQQLVRAEDVTLSLASAVPSSQLDANSNSVTIDISSQETRTITPGIATKMWIVQPAANTIDNPINVSVQIQDGQDIDGNGNGNIVTSSDPKAVSFSLDSSNPTWTGLGPNDPNDGDTNDALNGSTITVRGGVGVFKLETAIAEDVTIGLTAAASGFANRFNDGDGGIYFNVANMAKTVTFSPGVPTQYAIKPKPANGSLYDSAETDKLTRFNFPIKIYDKGGNAKTGVTGKVTVQASIPGGTVTLYNGNETLSSTSGQLTLDVANGVVNAKFTTSKAGTVSLSLLQAATDPLANMNVDPTVHQVLVTPGPVKKLAIIDPTDIKTTSSIVVADAPLASSMNTTPVVVRAYDFFSNFVNTYAGTSVFLNGDSTNMEIVNFTDGTTISNTSSFNNGEAFFYVRNKTAEVVNLTLSDNTNSLTGIDYTGVQAQQNIQFFPGLVAQYSFEVPAKYLAPGTTDATADGVISLQVFARDIYGNHNTIAAESTYPTDLTIDLALPSGATGDFANTIGVNSGYGVPITNGVGNFDVRIRKFAADRFDSSTATNLGGMSGKEGATLNFASSANSYSFMASKRIFFNNGTATYLTMENPDPSLTKTTDDTVAIYIHARDQNENLDVNYASATVDLATTGSSVLAGGATATFAAGIASKNITNTKAETVTLSMTGSTGAVASSTALPTPFTNDGFLQSQDLLFNPGAPTSYFFAASQMAPTQTVPSANVGPLTQDSSSQLITVDSAARIYVYAVDNGGNIVTSFTDTTTGLYTVSANNSGSIDGNDPAYGNFTNGEGSILLSDQKSETLHLILNPTNLSLGKNTADVTFDHGVVTSFAWSTPTGTTIDQLATVNLQAKDQYNNNNIKYNGTLTTSGGPAGAVVGTVNMEPYVATLANDYDPSNNSHLQQSGGYNISMTNGTASVKLKALRATTFNLSVDTATSSADLGTLTSSSGSISFIPGIPKYFEIVDSFDNSYNVYTSSSTIDISEDAIAGTLNSLTTDSYTNIGFKAIDSGGNISTAYTQANPVSVTATGNIDFKSSGATGFTPQQKTKGVSFTNGVGLLDMRSKDATTIALSLTGFAGSETERGNGQKSVTFAPGSFKTVAFTAANVSTVAADQTFSLVVEADDQFGNKVPTYNGFLRVGLETAPGTVVFPGDAGFPSDVVFPATTNTPAAAGATSDGVIKIINGVGTLAGFEGHTSGNTLKLVIVEDNFDIDQNNTLGATSFFHNVTVTPGTPAAFTIAAAQSNYTIDNHAMFTVNAVDSYGNQTSAYAGNVYIKSSNANIYQPSNTTDGPGVGGNAGDEPVTTKKYNNGSGQVFAVSGGTFNFAVNSIYAQTNISLVVQSESTSTMTIGQSASINFSYGSVKYFRIIQPTVISSTFHGTVDNPVAVTVQALDRGKQQIVANYNTANVLSLALTGGTPATADIYSTNNVPGGAPGTAGTTSADDFASGIGLLYVRSKAIQNLTLTLSNPPTGTSIDGTSNVAVNFMHGAVKNVLFNGNTLAQTTDANFNLQAKVVDQYGNTADTFVGAFKIVAEQGTLSYNSSVVTGGEQVTIPSLGLLSFANANNGVSSLNGISVTSSGKLNGGFQQVKFGLQADSSFDATGIDLSDKENITVENGVAALYRILPVSSSSITAGVNQTLKIRVEDANGNAVDNASSSSGFSLSLNGPGAVPANTTVDAVSFSSQNTAIARSSNLTKGIISLTINSTTTQTIIASISVGADSIPVSAATTQWNVNSGVCKELLFNPATAATTTVDNAFNLVVEARDQYGNASNDCTASFQLSATSPGTLDFVAGKGVGVTKTFTSGQTQLTIPVQNKISGDTGVTTINFGIANPSAGITTYTSTRAIDFTYGVIKKYSFDLTPKAGNASYTVDDVIPFVVWARDQFGNRVLTAAETINIKTQSSSSPFVSGNSTNHFSSGVNYTTGSGFANINVETLKAESFTLKIQSTGATGVTVNQTAPVTVIAGSAQKLRIISNAVGSPSSPGTTDGKIKVQVEVLDKGNNRVLTFNPASAVASLHTSSISGSDITQTDLTTSSSFSVESTPYQQTINIQSFTSGVADFYVKSKSSAQFLMGLTNLALSGLTQLGSDQTIQFDPGSVDHIAFISSDASTTADTPFTVNLQAQDQFGNLTTNFTGSIQVIDKGTGTTCSSLPSSNFVFSAGVASRNDLQCTKAGTVILGLQNVPGTSVPNLPATHNLQVTHGTTNLRFNLYAISDVSVSTSTTTNVRVEQQDQYGNRADTLSSGSGFSFNLNLTASSVADIKTANGTTFSTGTRLFTIPDNTGFLDIQLKSTVAQSVNANLSSLPAGYNLVPSSGGRTFQFIPGAASSLVFSSVAQTLKTTENIVLGVQAQDSFGNNANAGGTVVINASDSSSLVIGSTGTIPLTNGAGSITIQRTTPTASSVSFTMSGTSLDVTGQTFLLTVVPGDPSQILFGSAPTGKTVDNTAVAINFNLTDAYGNATTVSSGTVNATLAVTSGSAIFNASATNQTSITWNTGSTSQKTLNIHDNIAESAVISVSSASDGTSNLSVGSPLSVVFTHGTPSKYAYSLVPNNPKTDQTPQLKVELQDQYSNVATSVSNKDVTLSLSQASGISGVYSGGATKTLSSGTQTFAIESATRQVLTASVTNANGYANPSDVQINFLWGAAASLSYELVPSAVTGVNVGTSWTIKSAVLDGKSNKLLEHSGSVKLNLGWMGASLIGGGTAVAPTFSSAQTAAYSTGVATWSMTGNGAGSLTVTATQMTGAGTPSNALATFPVNSGAPTKIIIGSPGSDGIISAPTTVQVYLQDNFGNSSKYTGNITFDVRAGQNISDGRSPTSSGYHNVSGHPTSRAISFANANSGNFDIKASSSGWTNVYVPTPPGGMSMQSGNGVDFYFLPGTPVEYKIVTPTSPSAALFHSTVADSSIYQAASGVPQTLKIQAIDVTGAPSVNWGGCVNVTLGANARPQVSTVCLTSGEGTFEFYDEFVESIPVSLADQSSDNLHDGGANGACPVASACTASLSVGKSRAKEIRISNVATNSPVNQSAFPASLYSYPVIRSTYGISSGSECIVSTATVYDESNNVFTNYKANYSIGGCSYVLGGLSTLAITNGTANRSCSDPNKRTLGISANPDGGYSGALPINRIGQNYRSTNNTISKFVLYCDGDNIVATDEQQSCFIRATDSYGYGSSNGLQNNSVSEVEGLSVDIRLEDNGGNLNPHSTGYIDEDKSLTLNAGDTNGTQGQALNLSFNGSVNLTSADSTHNSDYIHKRFLVANTTEEFVTVKLANIAYTGSIWSGAQISAVNTSATQSIYFTPAATANFEIASVTANVQDPALATSNDGQFYEITLNAKTASGNIATTENGFLYLDVSGGVNPLDLTQVRMKNGVAGSFSNTNSVLAQFSAGVAKVYVSSASQGDLVFSMRLPGASGEGFINNNVAKSFTANNASQLAIVAPTSSLYADNSTYNIQLQALDNFGNIDTTFGNAVTITLTKDSDSSNQISKITNLVGGKITFASGVATLNIATDQDGAHTLGASYAGITSASSALNFLLPIPDQIVASGTGNVAAGSVDLSFRAEKNGVLATNFSGVYDISYKNTSNVVISDGSVTGPSTITITNGLGSLTVKSMKGQTLNIVFTESFTNGAHPTFSSVTGLVFATGTPDHLTITSAPSGEYVLGSLPNLSIAVKDSVGSTVTDATMNVSLSAHDGAGCSSLNNTGFNYSSAGTAVSSGVATFTSLNVASNRTMSIQAFDTSASPITAACSTGTVKVYTPLAINIVGGGNATIGQAKVVEITGGLGTISLSPFTSALGSTATLVTSADASCNTAHCIKYTAGTAGGSDAFTVQDSASTPNQVNGAITIQVPVFTFLNGAVAMGAPFNMGQFVNTASGSQTITIKNTGNAPSGTITTTVTKDTASMWTVQNDFCLGTDLAVNATCDIVLVFESQLSGATPAAYQASIAVDSPNISTTTTQVLDAELLNPLEFLDGNNADALLGATLNEGPQANASGDVVFTIKVRHSNSSSQANSGSITITQPAVSNASFWSIDSSACDGQSLTTGSTCNVAVTFHAGGGVSAAESITIRASSNNTGQQDLTINASSN